MADDNLLGNSKTFPFSQSLTIPTQTNEQLASAGKCELLGLFGWMVQLSLAIISIGSLMGKRGYD